MRHHVSFAVGASLAIAGCDQVKTTPSPKQLNIELMGTPECLAEVTNGLTADLDIPPATMPIWSKSQIGVMEFGPIDVSELPAVRQRLRKFACVQRVRQRPCSTPLTDVVFCRDSLPPR